MTVIGVTGPSGAGKGAASEILNEKYGFPVIDADKVYHTLVCSPSDCLEEIKAYYGESVIDSNGALDRRALGKLVLGEENREKLELLNKITHKYVVSEILQQLSSLKERNSVCVIDAPLLIEADLCRECDFTVSVIADKGLRAERIAKRDGISIDAALKRINSQKCDEFYIKNTDYTLENNSSVDDLASAVCKILSERRVFS